MATEEKKAVPHDKENDHVLSEAYAEAEKEQKAATLRAEKSLEERQADFKKMLLEREVHNTVYVVILKEAAMLKDQVFTSSPPLCVYVQCTHILWWFIIYAAYRASLSGNRVSHAASNVNNHTLLGCG